MDIPDEIHKKLVCVAKRGRFSHIVAPRVWQAPDGRILQILDDQTLPLDETFYKALVAFEKAELAKESDDDAEEVESKQAVPLTSSASAEEVVEIVENNTKTASSLNEVEDVAKLKPEQTAFERPRVDKVYSHSILAYVTSNKKAKTSSSSFMLDQRVLSTEFSNKGDKEVKIESNVSTGDSSVPPIAIRKPGKDDSESTKGELRKVETVFSLRDCLIHLWDARIRARCYVLQSNTPKNSKSASTSPSLVRSDLEIIIWFRLGCVRLENNLAFAQALWLANKKSAKVHAIAFAPAQQPPTETGAYQGALFNLQGILNQEFDLRLTVFDANESTATSLLALWTRMRPVLGIFTTESYNAGSMRVTQATSRAVQCPVFNFDSENPVPLKYLQASAKDTNLDSLDAFKSHADKHRSLPDVGEILREFKRIWVKQQHNAEQNQRKVDSTSTPSTDSIHSSPDEQQQSDDLKSNLPDIVEKRWKTRGLQLDDAFQEWSEDGALELANKVDTNEEQIVGHFHIGTLSPFSVVESRPELFFGYSWKFYRTFLEETKNTL